MERAETAEDRVALTGSNNVPLRHLVYRVHKLPPSLRTYVYDFGKLSTTVEQKYIELKIEKGLERIAAKSRERYLNQGDAADAGDDGMAAPAATPNYLTTSKADTGSTLGLLLRNNMDAIARNMS